MSWQINALHFGTLAAAPSKANDASHLSDKKISLGGHGRIQIQERDIFQGVLWWHLCHPVTQPICPPSATGLGEFLALPLQADSLSPQQTQVFAQQHKELSRNTTPLALFSWELNSFLQNLLLGESHALCIQDILKYHGLCKEKFCPSSRKCKRV